MPWSPSLQDTQFNSKPFQRFFPRELVKMTSRTRMPTRQLLWRSTALRDLPLLAPSAAGLSNSFYETASPTTKLTLLRRAQRIDLPTGVGKGSIGVDVLKGLLAAGAVVVTTSRYSREAVDHYKGVFINSVQESKLVVVPSSGAPSIDVVFVEPWSYDVR